MGRYIDADALIKALRLEYPMMPMFKESQKEWAIKTEGYRKAEEVIKDAPSIDIEPKHGEWKPFDLTWGRSVWYCTACEESVEVPCDIWTHKPIYNFCPYCGADMREVRDE